MRLVLLVYKKKASLARDYAEDSRSDGVSVSDKAVNSVSDKAVNSVSDKAVIPIRNRSFEGRFALASYQNARTSPVPYMCL